MVFSFVVRIQPDVSTSGFFLNLPKVTENDVGKVFKRDKRFLSMIPGQIKIFNLNLKAMFKKIIPTILL